MAWEVIGATRDGKLLVWGSTSGPSSYSAGGFSVTVPVVRKVLKVLVASASGGYKVEPASISVSGNTLTVPVFEYNYPATASGPATQVGDGTDLSGVTFEFLILGV